MRISFLFFIVVACLQSRKLAAQDTLVGDGSRMVLAGPEYAKPASFQKLWGKNRRLEWLTPVTVPLLLLDKYGDGLKPDEAGGGNETNSLRLQSKNGKEYTIRSINKSREDVIDKEFKNTFIEDINKDGISMSHPYSAFAMAVMQEAAGIYHTQPMLVYVPKQAALDTFNDRFGNDLYLFERRLGGNWDEADHLGNFRFLEGTDDVVEKLLKDNDVTADQKAYLKARLFDVLIADWDRHEDNWKWGSHDTTGRYLFEPIPRDRDQAFFTHNGVLIDRMLSMTGLSFMQNFGYNLASVKQLSFEERNMDRFFTNSLTKQGWISTAKFLKDVLTDEVIAASVKGLPLEIFQASGEDLIEKLKSRREQLTFAAESYYDFLAREVEIPGSQKAEKFVISANIGGGLSVGIYRKNEFRPYYNRIFSSDETEEVILYGMEEDD